MEIKYVNDNGEVRWQPVDKWGRPIQRQSGAGTVLQGGEEVKAIHAKTRSQHFT